MSVFHETYIVPTGFEEITEFWFSSKHIEIPKSAIFGIIFSSSSTFAGSISNRTMCFLQGSPWDGSTEWEIRKLSLVLVRYCLYGSKSRISFGMACEAVYSCSSYGVKRQNMKQAFRWTEQSSQKNPLNEIDVFLRFLIKQMKNYS